jgi:hypothetical protein
MLGRISSLLLAFSLCLASRSGAEAPPSFVLAWGSSGTGQGQFNAPYGLAVHSSGQVYVVDSNNKRIERFDANGVYLGESAVLGVPIGMTIDSNDDEYVVNSQLLKWGPLRQHDANG